MGYWAVGGDYFDLSEQERARKYFTKAFQLRERTSKREKLEITASDYRNVSSFFKDNMRKSWRSLGKPCAAPDSGRYASLALALLAMQRFDEARQIIHEAQVRKIDNYVFHDGLYALAFLAAESVGWWNSNIGYSGHPYYEHYGLALTSDTEAYGGRLGRARDLNRQASDSAVRADNKENGAIYLADAALEEAAYGNAAKARQTAAEALKLDPASQGAKSEAALAFPMSGDTGRGESLAQNLNKRFLDTQMQSLWVHCDSGAIGAGQEEPSGRPQCPVKRFPLELATISFTNNLSCFYPTYVRGEA